MTVKELMEKLSSLDLNSQVLVQYLNADAYGSGWVDIEDLDEDHVIVNGDTVILDISDKYT